MSGQPCGCDPPDHLCDRHQTLKEVWEVVRKTWGKCPPGTYASSKLEDVLLELEKLS